MNVAEWLAATARLRSDAPALLTGFDLDADYATFARRAAAIGAALSRDYGIRAWRPRRPVRDQLHAIPRMPLRHLVDRRGRDPDQCQAARPRGRLDLQRRRRQAAFVSDDTVAALAEAKSDLPAAMKTLSVDSDAYRKMRERRGTRLRRCRAR